MLRITRYTKRALAVLYRCVTVHALRRRGHRPRPRIARVAAAYFLSPPPTLDLAPALPCAHGAQNNFCSSREQIRGRCADLHDVLRPSIARRLRRARRGRDASLSVSGWRATRRASPICGTVTCLPDHGFCGGAAGPRKGPAGSDGVWRGNQMSSSGFTSSKGPYLELLEKTGKRGNVGGTRRTGREFSRCAPGIRG